MSVQQQQQQPPLISSPPPPPAVFMNQQAQTGSSGHHHGSVGPVIGVLAVIAVLGVLAGMVGRLCSGKSVMGYGHFDVEGWIETKCSACLDGHVGPPSRSRSVAVPLHVPVLTTPVRASPVPARMEEVSVRLPRVDSSRSGGGRGGNECAGIEPVVVPAVNGVIVTPVGVSSEVNRGMVPPVAVEMEKEREDEEEEDDDDDDECEYDCECDGGSDDDDDGQDDDDDDDDDGDGQRQQNSHAA